jgi:hypothetical protein
MSGGATFIFGYGLYKAVMVERDFEGAATSLIGTLVFGLIFWFVINFSISSASSDMGEVQMTSTASSDGIADVIGAVAQSKSKNGNMRLDFYDVNMAFEVAVYTTGEVAVQEIDPKTGDPKEKYIWHTKDSYRFGRNPMTSAGETIRRKINERTGKTGWMP